MRAKAPRTANLARGVLSHVWKTVGLPDPWGQCRTRPRKTIPFRPLTDDEVSCALAEAAKVAPWWRPLILVGFYTGLRSRLAAVSSCEMGLVMALKNAVNGLRP